MGQSFEEAKAQLLSSGKPGKLLRQEDGTWSVCPLPDKDPIIEQRKQEQLVKRALEEAERVRLEEERTKSIEALHELQRRRDEYDRLASERREQLLRQLKERAIKRDQELEARRRAELSKASQLLLDSVRDDLSTKAITEDGRPRGGFSDAYRAAIESSLRHFLKNGDDVACTGVYIHEYGRCQLCGHEKIKWHYILENLCSRRTILVGSECINNYWVILEEWGYRPAYIVFPGCLRNFTGWISSKEPRSIQFSDAVAGFYTKEPLEIYKQVMREGKIQSFYYVTRNKDSLEARNAVQDDWALLP